MDEITSLEDLKQRMNVLGLTEDDPTCKKVVCNLVGHSNIIKTCWGYVYCSRCGDQIGDSLGGFYSKNKAVIVGHNCEVCKANFDKVIWKDTYLAPDPFVEEEEDE
jgi:hypothetical protein